jgi:hypothetical protein
VRFININQFLHTALQCCCYLGSARLIARLHPEIPTIYRIIFIMSYTVLDKKIWIDMSPSFLVVLLQVKILKIIIIIDTDCSIYFLLVARFDLTSPLLRRRSSPPPLSSGVWFEVPLSSSTTHVNYKTVNDYDYKDILVLLNILSYYHDKNIYKIF